MDHRKTFISSDTLHTRLGFEAEVALGWPNPYRRRPMMFRASQSALARAGVLGVLACALCVGLSETAETAQGTSAVIDVGTDANGNVSVPAEFELQGQWTAVRDPTAKNGLALQYSGVPAAEDRLPLAIYKPAFLKNAEISLRLKADLGQSDRAGGVALRITSPQDYYLVQLDARREEIVFSRMKDGASEEIADVDADMTPLVWHTLTVRLVDDEFTVSFDGKWVFTGFDQALSQPGSVALWTRGDSVARFDNFTITPLAVGEETQLGTE